MDAAGTILISGHPIDAARLSELFDRPVDLVAKRALHRLIRDDVLAEARTLYAA